MFDLAKTFRGQKFKSKEVEMESITSCPKKRSLQVETR